MKKFQTVILSLLLLVNLGFSQSQSEKPIVIKANYFDISPPFHWIQLSNPERLSNLESCEPSGLANQSMGTL